MSRGKGKLRFRQARPVLDGGPASASPVLGCIKVPYESESAARKGNPRQHPYRCRLCRRWHTTKTPQRRRGARGRRARP